MFEHIQRHWSRAGFSGIYEWAMKHCFRKFRTLPRDYIFEKEWDVLVILDACRVDLLDQCATQYNWLPDRGLESVYSAESSTREWMQENFDSEFRQEIKHTTYVCSNPQSDGVLSAKEFENLDEVWRYAWDDELGTVPPRPVTDRTIAHARRNSPERLIVHYMQPHIPFIGSGDEADVSKEGLNNGRLNTTWSEFQRGERSRQEIWNQYKQNLELVLDDVTILLENIEAEKVVVSSDHGNAMGEWGIYEHPPGVGLECLRQVPWVTTSAKDKRTHEPASYKRDDVPHSVEERLRSLGYV